MTVMTQRIKPAENGQPAAAHKTCETGPEPVSRFTQHHCRCSAGQRIIAVLVTAIAVLQILALGVSVQSSSTGYENLADVSTALGSGGRP